MGYSNTIRDQLSGLGASADPAHIEAWIRVEHPTLDALSPAQFRREVLTALACARAATQAENDALAASFGLTSDR